MRATVVNKNHWSKPRNRSQIGNRVDALRNKHTLALYVAPLHPLAGEFSIEWTRAVGDLW